jgi:3-oxoacyl-[acyl-carrier protein] reductase
MSLMRLENKVAIVTGGTRGIGQAIAARLLREGGAVAICGTRQQTVDEAVRQLSGQNHADSREKPGRIVGMVADVSKPGDVKGLIAGTMERLGRIDALVNNAGVGTFRAVAELTPEEWERMIGLNLSGVYYCCHEVLPIFKQQQSGDIINISSLAGKNPFAGGAGYNASKFGLNGFSESMMLDHRNDGVRVSYIMPGSVATGFGGGPADSGADWKIAPEDVAEVVATLLCMPQRTTVSRVEIRPSRPPVPQKISKKA